MANRYWVGGSGNWHDTTHWSTASGSAGGASLPTWIDDVYFDAGSFSVLTAGKTVTIDAGGTFGAECNNMDWTGAANVPMLAASAFLINIYGSLTLISAMTFGFNNQIIFRGNNTGSTFTSAGLSIICDIYILDPAGTREIILQDNLTFGLGKGLYVSGGVFRTNNHNVSCGTLQMTSSSNRSVYLGSSIITCSDNFEIVNDAGLTFDAGTSTINLTGNNKTFAGAGKTYNNVNLQGTFITTKGSNTIATLGLTAGKTYIFSAGSTQTLTAWSGDGTDGNQIHIQSAIAGSPFAISMASGTVIKDYYWVKDSTVSGGATFGAFNSIDVSGNSGWTWGTYMTYSGSFTTNSVIIIDMDKYTVAMDDVNILNDITPCNFSNLKPGTNHIFYTDDKSAGGTSVGIDVTYHDRWL